MKKFHLISSPNRAFDIDGDGKVTLADFRAIFTGERYKNAGTIDVLKQRTAEVWKANEHNFVLLSLRIQKREKQTRGAIRKILCGSRDGRIDKIARSILSNMADPALTDLQEKYAERTLDIKKAESALAEVEAASFMSDTLQNPKVSRTKAKFIEQADLAREETRLIVDNFKDRLAAYQINITSQQAEVLLSRIDVEDISRISAVFGVAASISQQLAQAKQASGENTEITKRYYGIYIGLLEIQEAAQTDYIKKIDKTYLPGIQKIRQDALELRKKTSAKSEASSPLHKEAYQNNIASQNFTISVTEKYQNQLLENREKISDARRLVKELHSLAENTLGTVRVSSDLAALIQQSQTMFEQVISLQAPDLVPFESLALQREFESVTNRLRLVST